MDDKWGSRPGARALLFDRLVDEHPHRKHEPTPQRGLDPDELYASIRRELVRLLSTRCPLTGDEALNRRRTVIDYGLPDLEEGGRALVREDRMRMARLIRQAIEAYEPRLRSVEVEVISPPGGTGKLVVSVEALLSMEQMRAPLSFSIPLGGGEEGGDGG
jgi:type VI secretion system protein ImpF